jgi:hypothetical protein
VAGDWIVTGFISSLKTAVIVLVLAGTAGAALAGTVNVTLGRVVSGVATVVKFHTNGLANPRPVARLWAPVVIVAV